MAEIKPAYFNARHIDETQPVYVCWLDVMGSQNAMLRSVRTAANFVCKIHDTALSEYASYAQKGIHLYPVMDGIYVTCPRQGPLRYFVSAVMRRLAETFLQETKPQFRFLVRGCIAYGPLVEGREIGQDASYALAEYPEYRNSILIGMPLAQAYRGEREAPPYGIFVDESARAFCAEGENSFHFIWWDWYSAADPPLDAETMYSQLMEHFAWCAAYTNTTGYHPDRIAAHRRLAAEYFNRVRRTDDEDAAYAELKMVEAELAPEPSRN